MKILSSMLLLLGLALGGGCKERPRVEPAKEETRKPVVALAPVPTKPFEEGYNAGFDLAKQQAVPRAKMPEPAEVQRLAQEQAAGHADRPARWERGFVDGYTEGFRNVVTGLK
jgi:hypothetical protein